VTNNQSPVSNKQRPKRFFRGAFEDVLEAQRGLTRSATEQLGLRLVGEINEDKSHISDQQLAAMEQKDRRETVARREQIEKEIEQIRQERLRREQERQAMIDSQMELARQPKQEAFQEPAPRQKRNILGGLGIGRKKQSPSLFSALQKSQAETAGQRASG